MTDSDSSATSAAVTTVTSTEVKEKKYNDGATPLYFAIEETDWRQALDIAEADPEQVRTWIRSTGTENTTFAWSMWRRLPIHEACRRQAPAWLVSSLFSAFPESAYLTTQFGELPLHLSVESGAAPEVVNLIMVANWGAIVTPDNSGRIPTDILDRGELLLLDDHKIVHESLMRCHKAYMDMQKEAQDEQAAINRKHKGRMTTTHRQHQEALKNEQAKQDGVRQEIASLEGRLEEMKEVELEKEMLVAECQLETLTWKEKVETLVATIELLQEELGNESGKIEVLEEELDEKEEQISNREELIELLSKDLRNISVMHDEDLMESVHAAEQTMRAMVSSQIALQKQLTGQASGLKTLLVARGIDLPEVSSSVQIQQEEKYMHPDEEDPVDPNDVASALAAAAMSALQKHA